MRDGSDTVTYSLSSNPGGLFQIDPATGVVSVAPGASIDYETATSHTIEVTATSSDSSTSAQSFTIGVTDDTSEFTVTAVTDTDVAADQVAENAAGGTVVGITAFASDADGSDTVTYSLSSNPGGLFQIDPATGVVSVAPGASIDYETATSHTIEVTATSSDSSTSAQSFTIGVTDDTSEFTVTAVTDTDGTADQVAENATGGTVVGITAFASDADGSDTVTYSLTDDAGGLFQIDPATGVVTVAPGATIDYETATSHTIEVTATSSDSSTSAQSFTIGVTDDTSEFTVTAVTDTDVAADQVAENATGGTVVGITAFASDADGSDTVSYSLSSNPGGLFQIDPATGVVTVAPGATIDYETATSHTIEVTATSSDSSTSAQSFTIGVTDDTSEFTVTAVTDTDATADQVAENATGGTVVGITAFASDADGSDTVTYSLSSNPGGLFQIDPATGVVSVAPGASIDYETATSHTIGVTATSSDSSTSAQSFTIGVTDDTSEFTVTAVTDTDVAADQVAENATGGTVVGITAFASDADGSDTVTYSLSSNPGGLFQIDPATGVVSVAPGASIDYETATSHTIEVTATSSDSSTSAQSFTIGVTDDTSEFTVTAVTDTDVAADQVAENATAGTVVGITAFASDADGSDTVTYSLSSNPGGLFQIDPATGVVTVAPGATIDYETATSHTIEVTATSSDSSTSAQSFTIGVTDDTSEFTVTAVTDTDVAVDQVAENATAGTVVGITAFASDADGSDTVTYSLSSNPGGLFQIDPATGVVSVAPGATIDYETATSHTIEVTATSSDSSTSAQSFTIGVTDDTSEFTVTAVTDTDATADQVAENATGGTVVGITAFASDADGSDTVTYSLSSNPGGLFQIDPATGVVSVAPGATIDYETATSHVIEVTATSTDGSTSAQSFTIGVTDDNSEFSTGAITDSDAAANSVDENVANGTVVGITALATDGDASDSVTYSLDDTAGGRFTIDTNTGEITVANGSLLDHETDASHDVSVRATSTDGSTSTETFTINVADINEAPTDITFGTSVAENTSNGTVVDIALAVDPDAGDSHTYALTNDAGGRFTINPTTGQVTVADGSLLDFESATSHDITILTTDSGGLTYTETFTVTVTDENEAPTLSTSPVTGDEDTGIPLTISLTDLEPGATQSVVIGAVPTGAVLSAGTDNGDGTWTLTPGELTGLTITPPQHSDVDFQLTATGYSDDGSTIVSSPTETLDVTVDPVADAPNLTVTGTATGTEDGSQHVVMPASISGIEGDPNFSLTIGNVPTGASLSAGTDNGDGTWTLGTGDLTDLIITPPAGDDTNFTLSMSATADVTDTPVSESFDLGAGAFAYADDTFRSTSEPVYADGTAGAGLGETGGGLQVALGGVDDADILGMSGGWQTTINVTDTSTGTLTFRYNMTQTSEYENDEFSQVLVSVDGTLYGSGGNDYVAQITGDGNGGAAQTTGWQTFTVDVGTLTPGNHTITLGGYNNKKTLNDESIDIRFDDVQMTTTAPTTVNDTFDVDPAFVDLAISSSLVDTDGSESLAIVIGGVPTGASLSAGTDNGDGTWTLTQAELPGLTLVPPTDYVGTFQLTVTATATDGSDTANAVETIDVTVDWPINAAPTDLDVSNTSVDENAADGTVVGTASATDPNAGETFTFTLTDDAGGRFSIDPSTGEITVADGSLLDYEANASHNLTIEVTDSGGNTYTEVFTIDLNDLNEFAPTDMDLSGNGISVNEGGGNAHYLQADDGGAVFSGLTSFTAELQFAVSAEGATFTPLFSYAVTGGTTGANELVVGGGNGFLGGNIGVWIKGNAIDTGVPRSALFDGNLHQASVTWDSSTGTVEFYVDGVQQFSQTGHSTGQSLTGGGSLILGQEQDSVGGGFDSNQAFSGTYQDFRVFDDVRSSTEIANNVLSDVDPASSGLVADWRMNDLNGGTTTEIVSGNDMTVNAATGGGFTTGTAPVIIAPSISEAASNGTVVGTLSTTDADGSDTHTYTLLNDAGGRFAVDATTGEITVADETLIDFESNTSHTVTVQVTDSGGLTYTESFSISVLDADEAALPASAPAFTASAMSSAYSVSTGATSAILDANAGIEMMAATSAAETMDGADATQVASFADSSEAVSVDLGAGTASGGDAQGDTLVNVENLIGSAHNDTLTGDSGDNVLAGLGGADTLSGGAGDDTLVGGDGGDGVDYTTAVEAHTPVGYWRFEETTGTTAADSTAGGNDGTYYNGVTLGTTGVNGTDTAATFDGSNDYILVSNDSSLQPSNGTIQLWFNTNDASDRQGLLEKNENQEEGDGIRIRINNGRIEARLQTGEGSYRTITSSMTVDTSTWHHVAVTFGSGGFKLYVDGQLAGTNSTTESLSSNTASVEIGRTGSDYFDGQIDEVALHDQALSQTEIQGLVDAGNNAGGPTGDTLIGGAGIDTATYADSGAGVTVDLAAGTGSGGTAEGDTLSEIENVTGSAQDDVLIGDSGANVLEGGSGHDVLEGAGGADTLDGGGGIDTASYAGSSAAVDVDLGAGTASGGDAQGDTLSNIENLTGSAHDDTLTGDSGANVLTGGGGADTLTGGAGDDILIGGGASGVDYTAAVEAHSPVGYWQFEESRYDGSRHRRRRQ